ncbi:Fe-S protein assembly co-chaperone HscB [Rickettsiales bacterium]|nr:Fe-S protein assembly co-chaperone HscB [Rickettsiales bacterium]
MNYFKIFDITPNLDLCPKKLEEKYLDLQLQFHPDLLINKSIKEQENSKTQSSNINNAYEILQDPLKRAIHLLEINNIFIDSIGPDNMLLMEIMEIKEDLEGSDLNKIKIIKQDLEKRKNNLYQEIIKLTNQNLILEASKKIILLKYLSNI